VHALLADVPLAATDDGLVTRLAETHASDTV
jgi:hypothetical protein